MVYFWPDNNVSNNCVGAHHSLSISAQKIAFSFLACFICAWWKRLCALFLTRGRLIFLPALRVNRAVRTVRVRKLPNSGHKSQERSQKQHLLRRVHKSAAHCAAQARRQQNYSLSIHFKWIASLRNLLIFRCIEAFMHFFAWLAR